MIAFAELRNGARQGYQPDLHRFPDSCERA
jgi:hypothetical protein